MLKRILVVITALTAAAAVFTVVWFQRESLVNPFAGKLAIEAPTFAGGDEKGNIYVIDSANRRIVQIHPNGSIGYIINGGNADPESFFYAKELVCDAKGNLYVLSMVMDAKFNYTVKEQILQFGPDGTFVKVLYQKSYEREFTGKDWRLIRRGRITSLEIENAFLYWFELENDAVVMSRADIFSDNVTAVKLYTRPFEDPLVFLADVRRADDTSFMCSTKKGEILKVFADPAKANETVVLPQSGSPVIPWEIGLDRNGTLYFSDLASKQIRALKGGALTSVVSRTLIEKEGHLLGDTVFYGFEVLNDGTILTTNTYSIIQRNGISSVDYINAITRRASDGTIDRFFNSAKYKLLTRLHRFALWAALIAGFALVIFAAAYLFFRIMSRRFSLILKQLALFIPITLLSLVFVIKYMFDDFTARYDNELLNKIALLTQNIAQNIDPVSFVSIDTIDKFMNDDYRALREHMHASLNYNRDEWNDGFYCAAYRLIGRQVYALAYFNDSVGVMYPFVDFEDEQSPFRAVYDSGRIITGKISSFEGDLMYGMGPIRDTSGAIVGFLEVGTDLFGYQESNRALFTNILKSLGLIIAAFVAVIIGVTYVMLKSVRILRNAVNRLATGEWETSVDIKSTDEVGDLSNGFNKMALNIRNHINEILELNRGYQRFVPEQILNFLDKQKVTDVALGDQVQKEMTILFSDIRNFTTISEKLSPKENFDFLNEYLRTMGPVVREHNGFIDKYIGDAIMALFPVSPDDAIASSLSIINRLYDFNQYMKEKGMKPIGIGIGIHTGLLMLGILGESERMDGTVISDNVNLASRLEGLTKQYKTALIISETVLAGVKLADRYLFRYLGLVQVKGKNQPIGIYEVLDALSQNERELRTVSKKQFEDGIRFYQNQDFESAAKMFKHVLKNNRDDGAAELYLKASLRYQKLPAPRPWDGTLKMVSK